LSQVIGVSGIGGPSGKLVRRAPRCKIRPELSQCVSSGARLQSVTFGK